MLVVAPPCAYESSRSSSFKRGGLDLGYCLRRGHSPIVPTKSPNRAGRHHQDIVLAPLPYLFDSPGDSILSSDKRREKHSRQQPDPPTEKKKSVSFSLYEEIHESKYSKKLYSVGYEPFELWYSRKEYRAFREREIRLTKELSNSIPKKEFARDGIESIAYRRVRKQRTEQAKLSVLKEQEACWEDRRLVTQYMESEDYIRQAYSKLSRKATILARTRGNILARQVEAMEW